MSVIWLPGAELELRQIEDYLNRTGSPNVAAVVRRILMRAASLDGVPRLWSA